MLDIDALRQISLFAQLKDEQLQWISEQGVEVWLQPGDRIATQGDPPDGFYIILEGQTEWTRKVGQQDVYATTLGAGTIFAELILLLAAPYPTSGRALTAVRLFKLEPDAFWNMLSVCPSVLRGIVTIAAQRSQLHEAVSQEHAKLVSLGTLAAGLAHELNNPAAAVSRGTKYLHETVQGLSSRALKLNQFPMTATQQAFLANLPKNVIQRAKAASRLDPLTQSEREDEVSDWLVAHSVADSWQLAPTLVSAGLNTDWLDTLADQISTDALGDVLAWLEAEVTAEELLYEIEQGATRISALVKAVKEYSFMDQAPLQKVDLHEGLNNTLVMLKHKLKKGEIVVIREYDPNLPHICAHGSELNQVWTNLIDNAIDALEGHGQIWVRTSQETDRVLVEIADDGLGIPPEVQPRIFEPFFTTKGVGQGTGLGLDISYRIVVGQHKGDIRVFSKPGDTRIQVRLPVKHRFVVTQD